MDLKIFSLGSNQLLAQKISDKIGYPLGRIKLHDFADGEKYLQFEENLRGRKIFLIQSTNQPDENLMRLLIGIDAVHRAGGRPIAVIPYFGYGRQERKSAPREPISARLVANLIETAGAKGVLTVDLHANPIEGFFQRAKFDQVYARPVFIKFLKKTFELEIAEGRLAIGSPDASGAGPGRARSYARYLGEGDEGKIPLIIIDKRRDAERLPEVLNVLGDVKGKIVVFVDDIIDTAGTIINAAEAVLANGATEVYVVCTHGLFSKDSLDRIIQSSIKRVFVTDTIDNSRLARGVITDKIEIVSIHELLAEAIRSIHTDESVSGLFN
ncbi:MAG: ribose-phosphate diphosphokinase [Parcubacteria group bacterium]|nr:ribose-phosphate diphosphokinase [Parcubacteria group bacterium]